MTNKIKTYLGFAVKARKLTYGIDALERNMRGVKLLLVSKTAAQNSYDKALLMASRAQKPVLVVDDLSETLHRPGCKVAGLSDTSLAGAIIKNAENEGYQLIQNLIQDRR